MNYLQEQVEGLLFQLRHIAKLESLNQYDVFVSSDMAMATALLESAAAFANEELVVLAATADRQGCSIKARRVLLPTGSKETYRKWCELGFPSLGLPVAIGGLGLPRCVQSAVQELGDGANLAFGMLCINLRCAALAVIKSANVEQQERWLPGLVSGNLASTIAISEPQAGSDVGRILTHAEPLADGIYALTGTKIWISYGDHDATDSILHLVLARLPGSEPGSRGLSLFAVPSRHEDENNGVNVLRLEHKMGLHASPTCVLELNAAKGELIGGAGRGLAALFVMMNNMRLAVAVQGAAVANAATLQAWRYAQERPQGGHSLAPPINILQHADVQRMLLEMSAESELLRALALRVASMLDTAESLVESDPATSLRWQTLAELILPIAKTYNAESAFTVVNQGIQVMGGYGYTSDYPLERMARDIRVAAIYEGTSGIQSLDFVKRKLHGDGGKAFKEMVDLINQDFAVGNSPFTAKWPDIRTMLTERIAAIVRLSRDELQKSEAGAYAVLQLTAQALHCWNGHTLYAAANADNGTQSRLRAALELYAGSVTAKAALWAVRSELPIPVLLATLR